MTRTLLKEGGNIFKDAEGKPSTQRIQQADVVPTLQWLEGIVDLELTDNMVESSPDGSPTVMGLSR